MSTDYYPRIKREQEVLQVTCHRCGYMFESVYALTHPVVACSHCRTSITVRPIKPTGPRKEPRPGIEVFTANVKESFQRYAATLPAEQRQAYLDRMTQVEALQRERLATVGDQPIIPRVASVQQQLQQYDNSKDSSKQQKKTVKKGRKSKT